MHSRKIFIYILTSLIVCSTFAQQENLYLNRDKMLSYEKYLNQYDKASFHSAMKPYIATEVYEFVYPDTVFQYKRLRKSDWFSKTINVVAFENIIEFDENGYVKHRNDILANPYDVTYKDNSFDTSYLHRKFYVAINPIVNIGLGYDLLLSTFINKRTLGFEIKADIGRKVSLYTNITNTVAKYPTYVGLYSVATIAVPGEGRSRPTTNRSFDFSNTVAYINYAPIKQLNFQIGNGKHFIGDGYRSLFLSDNANNYPYFQLNARVWRIKYSSVYTELLNNIKRGTDFTLGYQRKLATFNYLSIDAARWLQLGIFEGITWRRSTDRGNTFFDYNFINPILGVRAFQKKLDDNTSKIYGINTKVTLPFHLVVYGQYAFQKFGARNTINNLSGFQVGLKYFDVAGIPNLNLQVEVNQVRPYMYQGQDSALSYSHYNQSITHPMGANFREYLAMLNYQWKRIYVAYKFNFTQTGFDDSPLNFGNNIMKPLKDAASSSNIKIGNGTPYNIFDNELKFGYLINPKINLAAEFKMQLRNYSSSDDGFSSFNNHSFGISIYTNIFNRYYDLPILN